jgi:hypothetical protein
MMLHVSSSAPTTPEDALRWAKEAIAAKPRRFLLDTHVYVRMAQRDISERSIWHALNNAHTCVAFVPDRPPLTSGTSWRITGPDHEGDETSVGVEAFTDHLGRRLLIITVF